jgi:hypothetical protein
MNQFTEIQKPEKPANDDCCGGGACCPCVWDYYYEQLNLWEAQQATQADLAKKETTDNVENIVS